MSKKSKDFAGTPAGAIKNSITGKTIREMSWQEILSLPAERLSQTQALKRIQEMRLQKKDG